MLSFTPCLLPTAILFPHYLPLDFLMHTSTYKTCMTFSYQHFRQGSSMWSHVLEHTQKIIYTHTITAVYKSTNPHLCLTLHIQTLC
jgi:hypothetical protein